MKKTIQLISILVFAISVSGCQHFEKKASCDFSNYKSDNKSQKEDNTK